jgi:aminoglycoside phosphotransferase (APT) family kinase protein
MTRLSTLLAQAIASGDWTPLRAHLAEDAVLRSSNERGRRAIRGADAVIEHLAQAGPGELAAWDAREWPRGVAVTFEWHGSSGADRRRWYVRRDGDGRIIELWSAAARPQAAAELPVPPPDLLSHLGGKVVPLSHGGNSGAALVRIERPDARSLILKRTTPGADWLARVTGDDARTARLFEAGAFAAMPPCIRHGVVAVHRDGDAAWIVMEDVGDVLLDAERRLTREESRRVLRAAAALHATFADRVPDGPASLAARLGMSSPAVARAERAGSDLLPKQFEHAFEAFAEIVPSAVADPVLAAVEDAGPLAAALLAANGGPTLIHGDLRDDNLGFDGETVVLIDWDLATAGTPTVEFAWFLAQDAWRIDATHDEIESDHRAAHPELPERERELGMISGLVQYGWLLAHSARVHPDPVETAWGNEELAWWVPRVGRALERTGGIPAGDGSPPAAG